LRLIITLVLIFFVPNIFSSQRTNQEMLNDLQEICSQQLCWEDGSISVQLPDNQKLEVQIEIPLPIVQGSLIYLYPE